MKSNIVLYYSGCFLLTYMYVIDIDMHTCTYIHTHMKASLVTQTIENLPAV